MKTPAEKADALEGCTHSTEMTAGREWHAHLSWHRAVLL